MNSDPEMGPEEGQQGITEESLRRISIEVVERRGLLKHGQITAQATVYVVFACSISASAGFLYGYNIGVSGGVSGMPEFQKKFFPGVYQHSISSSYYCKHDDNVLQLFASSISFAAAAISIPGAHISKNYGRTMNLSIAGAAFVLGSVVLAAAASTPMLILGRIFWGIGIGLGDQAATIYSSEMAPPRLRGTLTMLFQLCIIVGIFVAQTVNLGTHFYRENGWRISLGAAALPGFALLLGGLLLPETPNSLIERGYLQKGRAVLEAIRGTSEVDAEYGTITAAHRREKAAGQTQYRTLLRRELRPHLAMNVLVPFLQQWTGINAFMFFSPFIFQSLGTKFRGEMGSLLSTMIVGFVMVIGTIVGITVVDRLGRRRILIWSTLQIIAAQLALGAILAVSTAQNTVYMSALPAQASIALICFFVFTYAYGWGPMGWVISAEIQPLETRCLGQGITVLVSLLNGAIIEQSFLAQLCSIRYGVYFLFAGLQIGALVFCTLFLPETTGIPIELMREVFRVHWYWKRFFDEEEVAFLQHKKAKEKYSSSENGSKKRFLDLGRFLHSAASSDGDKLVKRSSSRSGDCGLNTADFHVHMENNLPQSHRQL